MKKFTLTHEIGCNEETFWQLFFDNEFNETLFLKHLGFPEYTIVEQKKDDRGAIKRVVRGRPKMDMPKAVMKLLGDSFGYEEHGTFDPGKKVFSWQMKPNKLADKLRNEGSVRVEAAGGDKVKRITELLCEAKIFGVGGLIESSSEKEFRAGWDASAAFMNRWLKEHA